MNFHGILHRELLLTAKRRSSYYVRAGVGAVALLAALIIIDSAFDGSIPVTVTGKSLLLTLATIGLAWALFEGVLLTIDSISRERRDGTLGLLFLSNLTGYDIVFGKAGAAGLRTLFGLLAAAPAPALAFLFGGVNLLDYLQMFGALLNALLFALGIGLFLSVRSDNRRGAVILSALLVVWFAAGAPFLAVLLNDHYKTPTASLLFGLSPVTPIAHLFANSGTTMITASLAASNMVAWILLLAAGHRLQRSWQNAAATAVQPRRTRAFFPVAFLLSATIAVIYALYPKAPPLICVPPLLILYLFLAFEVTARAAKGLAEDRRAGALEILLTTPLAENEIVNGHLLSVKRFAAGPFAFILFSGAAILGFAAYRGEAADFVLGLCIYIPAAILLALHLWWSARIALWKGLQFAHPAKALRRTFGSLIVVILLAPLFGFFIALTLSLGSSGPSNPVGFAFFGATLFFLIASTFRMFLGATEGLFNLREVASNQIQ